MVFVRWQQLILSGTFCLMLCALTSSAIADTLNLSTRHLDTDVKAIRFQESQQRGFRLPATSGSLVHHTFANQLRVRGWQVADNLYFGQARVADQWGLGLLLKKDNIVYGLNHKGLQITREF